MKKVNKWLKLEKPTEDFKCNFNDSQYMPIWVLNEKLLWALDLISKNKYSQLKIWILLLSLTTMQAATTNVSASFMLAYYCDLDCDFSLSGSRFISDAAAAIGRRIAGRFTTGWCTRSVHSPWEQIQRWRIIVDK